jgi:starvation-inducible DNA-binding protein
MSKELTERMKVVLSSSFAFYLKCQYFHWNVEGPNFPQYHELFGKIYEEVHESIDVTAEHIRALDAYAPGSLGRFKELSNIMDETTIPSGIVMCQKLLKDNETLISDLTYAFTEAEKAKEIGLSNYLQDRIDIHKKHGWMLRATSKA